MTVRQFKTAARAAADNGDVNLPDVEIEVDERLVNFKAPSAGALAMAMTVGGSGDAEATADIINFFFSMLDQKDSRYFRSRLFNHSDPFGPGEIAELVGMLTEEWSGFPTKQPSDYLPSQENGGRRSTPRHRRQAASTA